MMFMVACAGGPEVGTGVSTGGAPTWVTNPSRTEGQDYVYVGSGTAGDASRAEQDAALQLIQQITQEIGVKITANTDAQARATLDTYEANILQSVQTESQARVSGFRIAERFNLRNSDGTTTVYIKALYNKKELDAEKARIQALFREIDDAVAVPEREGDSFESSGLYFAAIEKYIQAASAASAGEVDNADIKFERNVNKARELMGRITIVPLNSGLESTIGTAFAEPFMVKAVMGSKESDPGIQGVNLRVTYKTKRGNRISTATALIKTDAEGLASFTHPTPDFAAKDVVRINLDLNVFLDTLGRIPRKLQDQVMSLEEIAARNQASLEFSVVSNAKNIATAILVNDADQVAKVRPRSETLSGIMEVMNKNSFKMTPLAGNGAFLITSDDTTALTEMKRLSPAGTLRVIYGSFNLTEVGPEGGRFVARVSGTVKAVDVTTGVVLVTLTKSKRAMGSSQEQAIVTAFRQLGGDLGTDLVNQLP